MWHYNKTVNAVFVHHVTQYAHADISGLGWRRIKTGAPDGCTNLLLLMSAAKANNRMVHVDIDASNFIVTAYLL